MEEIKLTPKQKAFCDYYIANGGNATDAALKAGYSEKTAKQIGSENLSKPYVTEYLKNRYKQLETPRIATMQEVLEFWANTIRDENLEHNYRLKASEYIARTNAAFIDKVSHTGTVNVNNPLEGLSTEELKELLKK